MDEPHDLQGEIRDDYDVVVVGSGFGGAVTACRLAQAHRSVLVLERGAAYPPGAFARTPSEISENFWDPSRGLYGLFDLWSFRSLDAVVASGLGGGSLIYANVTLEMPKEWFDGVSGQWPIGYGDLEEHYPAVAQMLGVRCVPQYLAARMPKSAAFDAAAAGYGRPAVAAPVAVTFAPPGHTPGRPVGTRTDNLHRVQRSTCTSCGKCDFGCNEGAKNTLDLTYLSAAVEAGAHVRTLREVVGIGAVPDGDDETYVVRYRTHTLPGPGEPRRRRPRGVVPPTREVRARTVVMGAGAFGTTRLLLANKVTGLPRLSPALGTRFSGNGDAIGFTTGGTREVDSQRGPVITRILRDDDGGFLIEDGGYPSVLGWVGETYQVGLYGRGALLLVQRLWQRLLHRRRSDIGGGVSRVLGPMGVSRSTAPLLGMGMDPGSGTMRLAGDGTWLDLEWSPRGPGTAEYFATVLQAMRGVATGAGVTFRRGPSGLLSRGVTAHPLGGCPMGRSPADGVVDGDGRAFGHPGLFVADGSVMPTAVGANPSMTIAAFAERCARRILDVR
ncbi:cholesterol oxidase [Pseudonocardia sulfidoxydans NBRC 16205]|uniref:Cholesterol oxidase n=1 Tax=Pseudonocardia sulfidoxydans NBRC 16205 TaxID=1223511 RepID=A0A511DHQ4_9PSEU|nr:GMC oxidoreductase [Pseudonocardia sulfidoxydans]GEL24321.1 cholesterol oxidase [Pseudonocardia sulfidoxydans NBRC 16205]